LRRTFLIHLRGHRDYDDNRSGDGNGSSEVGNRKKPPSDSDSSQVYQNSVWSFGARLPAVAGPSASVARKKPPRRFRRRSGPPCAAAAAQIYELEARRPFPTAPLRSTSSQTERREQGRGGAAPRFAGGGSRRGGGAGVAAGDGEIESAETGTGAAARRTSQWLKTDGTVPYRILFISRLFSGFREKSANGTGSCGITAYGIWNIPFPSRLDSSPV